MKSGLVVRPWCEGDFARLSAAAPELSLRTLYLRFRAGMPSLPATYVASTLRRWPHDWNAVAALRDGRIIGWAEFGRYPDDPRRADVAFCVVDAEQGQGVGSALGEALPELMRGAGLVSISADIEPNNEPARRVWRRITGSSVLTYAVAS